jgi:hypothetical protein
LLNILNGVDMDLGLNNKIALVTAASQGLGKATALSIANEGATVIISPTNLILSFAKTGQGGSCIGGVPGFVGVSQPQGREASISLLV